MQSAGKCRFAARCIIASVTGQNSFRERRLSRYPIGLVVRVRMISGRKIEAQIVKIETTQLGTFVHIEFGEEVANVTAKQILGYYDFCFVKTAQVKTYTASA